MAPRFAHRSGKDIAMDLIKKLEEFRTQEQSLTWAGTFEEYFGIVTAIQRLHSYRTRGFMT